MEGVDRALHGRGVDLAGRPRHEQLEPLMLVAKACLPGEVARFLRHTLRVEPPDGLRLQRGVTCGDAVEIVIGRTLQTGARELGLQVGDEEPQRRQNAGRGRHQNGLDAEQTRQCPAVQRAGAAEWHQHEIARVVAALDRDDPDRAGHVVVGDGENAARRVF
jgi:hypothetical protein